MPHKGNLLNFTVNVESKEWLLTGTSYQETIRDGTNFTAT
jgi:hypothetical protein